MSNHKLADSLSCINQDNCYHVLRHPVFGTYLGDGIWSRDKREGFKAKVKQIEKCPCFLGNADLSKIEITLFGGNETTKTRFIAELELHIVFPDLPDNCASPKAVRSAMLPVWTEEC